MRRTKLALEALEDRSVPAASLSPDGLVFVGPQPQPPAMLPLNEAVQTYPVEALAKLPAVQLPAVQVKELYTILFPVFDKGDSAIGQVFANPDDPIVANLAKLPAVQLPAVQSDWFKIDPQPEPPVLGDSAILIGLLNQGTVGNTEANGDDPYKLGDVFGDTYANPEDPFLDKAYANPDDPFMDKGIAYANPDDPFLDVYANPDDPFLTTATINDWAVVKV